MDVNIMAFVMKVVINGIIVITESKVDRHTSSGPLS